MKRLFQFLDAKLGYILILPAIILILLFSIIPIFQSTRYSFFDFQLNDQQKSGLYFSEHYNLDLLAETHEYINYYLDTEASFVEDARVIGQIAVLKAALDVVVEDIYGIIGEEGGIVRITGEQVTLIEAHNREVLEDLNSIYSYDIDYIIEEDLFAVASELETAIIYPNFTGTENFLLVIKDPRVQHAFYITLFFTVVSVFFELCLGLALALIMNKAIRGRGAIRTFSLIPWAIPTSVAALIWAYLYNGSNGIVAVLMERVGILSDSADLLLSSTGSLWAIIIADVWKTTPYMALLLLAGLQTIPFVLYECSALDGATRWQQFIYITLPLLKPSILVALLFRTLDAFRVFDLIYVLTGGGPGGTTESISIYAYKVMFAQTRFGYGSATVLIMAVVVGIISYTYIKFLDVQLISDKG